MYVCSVTLRRVFWENAFFVISSKVGFPVSTASPLLPRWTLAVSGSSCSPSCAVTPYVVFAYTPSSGFAAAVGGGRDEQNAKRVMPFARDTALYTPCARRPRIIYLRARALARARRVCVCNSCLLPFPSVHLKAYVYSRRVSFADTRAGQFDSICRARARNAYSTTHFYY